MCVLMKSDYTESQLAAFLSLFIKLPNEFTVVHVLKILGNFSRKAS